MPSKTVQTLWIGQQLKPLHRECLKSFLHFGHTVDLYTYDEVEGVPKGVLLKNAEAILPRDSVFAYQKGPGKGSFSAFSNIFRYALLFERGGIWIDTDVFCLKPWEFENHDYLFASETLRTEQLRTTASCVIKVPPRAPVMQYCRDEALKQARDTIEWGEIGPNLLNRAVHRFGLSSYIRPSWEFCALGWDETELLTDPKSIWRPPQRALALHLNHEILRRASNDFNYDVLKKIQQWH